MKTIVFSLLLWGIASIQSLAIMMAPATNISRDDQRQFIIDLKVVGYFYYLRIYDANHILLDSTLQFTRGYDFNAFLVDGDNRSLEVLVVMSLDENNEGYTVFRFDGHSLLKIPNS
ncbi:MAG TPA: hypothetical protein ENJ51_01345 [Leucothrix mucor]|uniref:Uncharacterized protein n=1 Tax=Leucothrix mucor TaxID=45248 RepID=A0A7V2SXT4_LEUMU|nr:hypothetical protein [Leucothrix mucor]